MNKDVIIKNTSGQGEHADVPREIVYWNWGAFFLNWIWGIRNKTYIALLCVVPVFGFIMMIVVGLRGNEWAWKNRRWESIEQFQHEQKIWEKWGIRFGGFVIAMLILGTILGPIIGFLGLMH